ncbi:MAG TPA: oxygen-independent coproporphyrinogen III oxidase [Acetobacteraceae bacterium]
MDTSRLIAKYDQRVPRYTSYPTAPHFSPSVDGSIYAGWLRALPDDTVLSLYLHVPFCARLCLFCGCHTAVVRRPEPVAAYARDLLAEIDLVAETIGRRVPVRHIHWGGGTPTALPAEWMQAIDARLRARFDVRTDAEIAVEIDPRTLDADSLAGLALIGTTRASLGVQDFDPVVQRAVGRIQSYAMTADCAARLRGIGVGSINLDLIYGLPHQTEAGVATTVERALEIAPDRVAVFGYAHVPWMKKHQALLPEAALPDSRARFDQRQAAERVLRSAGYQAIGLDHFARPDDALAAAARTGRLRRNFQGYTADDAPVLLGLGASSIGSLAQGYVQNVPAVPSWRAMIRDGRLPVARGIALTPEDRLRRNVIERIMCDFAADLGTIAAAHAAEPEYLMDAAPALQAMAADGLLRWNGHLVVVTERGRPFVRCVAAAFDTYLRAGAGRHAVAV